MTKVEHPYISIKGIFQGKHPSSSNCWSDLRITTQRTPKVMSSTATYVERSDCDKEYIGETTRILRERYKEHLKEPSPIHAHILQTGYSTNTDNFNILGMEDQGLSRLIKESIYIRVNNPILNRNIGKFNLSDIQDRVLLNTPGLKLNNNKGQMQTQSNTPIQPIPP